MSDYDTQLAQFMGGIKKEESGGQYALHPNRADASGGYQFTKSTWQGAAGPYAKLYPEAYLAPPAIQDEVARQMMGGYYRAFGGDWSKVAMAWLEGGGAVAKGLNRSDGNITALNYASKVLSYAGLGGGNAAPAPPGAGAGGAGGGRVGAGMSVGGTDQFAQPGGYTSDGPDLHNVDTQVQSILGLLLQPANSARTVEAQTMEPPTSPTTAGSAA